MLGNNHHRPRSRGNCTLDPKDASRQQFKEASFPLPKKKEEKKLNHSSLTLSYTVNRSLTLYCQAIFFFFTAKQFDNYFILSFLKSVMYKRMFM